MSGNLMLMRYHSMGLQALWSELNVYSRMLRMLARIIALFWTSSFVSFCKMHSRRHHPPFCLLDSLCLGIFFCIPAFLLPSFLSTFSFVFVVLMVTHLYTVPYHHLHLLGYSGFSFSLFLDLIFVSFLHSSHGSTQIHLFNDLLYEIRRLYVLSLFLP